MKSLILNALAVALLLNAGQAYAAFTGDVTGGGIFSDDVSSDDGWLLEVADWNGVDFWTLNASANSTLSVSISSGIDFGISVYEGTVDAGFGTLFNNDGDFSTGVYVDGTNGFYSDGGSVLEYVLLETGGQYTIAVGGDSDMFVVGDGPYAYTMEVAVSEVPLPAAAWLFFTAIGGLVTTARRKKA